MNIINIISTNSHYIPLQYNNIKKYVKHDFRYIVLNNAMFNSDEFTKIKSICEQLNIEHIAVEKNDEVNEFTGTKLYTDGWIGSGVTPGATYALNYLSVVVSKILTGHTCLIHSDMFFLRDINLYDMLGDNDMAFVPQYRGFVKYIWDGFCVFNENVKLNEMNWMFSNVKGQQTDCGGCTHFYLEKYNPKIKYIEAWNISDYKDGVFDTHLNGNVRFKFTNPNDMMLTGGTRVSSNKSLEYESDQNDYNSYYVNKFFGIKSFLDSRNVNLPNPYWIDILMPKDTNDFVIIHYKSGSNYLDFQNGGYNEMKLKELRKLIG